MYNNTKQAVANIKYPSNLWKGLIAESVNGDEEEWLAIACCVRNRINRGISVGLCGLNRRDLDSFVNEQAKYIKDTTGKDIKKITQDIVYKVFECNHPDITNGADHYANLDLCNPYWIMKMQVIGKWGKHTFFKSK